MTLTEKLIAFMKAEEVKGTRISLTSSAEILKKYYASLGVRDTMPFNDWLLAVAEGRLPAYSSITRAIRNARTIHPRWRKASASMKRAVAAVKTEVGY